MKIGVRGGHTELCTGASGIIDELTTGIGGKANATDLTTHKNNTDIHVTTTDKAKWDKVDKKVDKTSITTTINSRSTDDTVPSTKSVYDNILSLLRNQGMTKEQVNSNIETFYIGTVSSDVGQSIGLPLTNGILGKIINIPHGAYPIQLAWDVGKHDNIFMLRKCNDGVWEPWQKVCTTCTTSVEDIPKTTLTPVFPGEVKVAPGGVAINYIVRNGWCNVNFAFNLASATTFPWTGIATGLPIPANNANILLTDESGKVNRTIAIRINSTGTVASRIPVAFTAIDWWTGNISYPVAES